MQPNDSLKTESVPSTTQQHMLAPNLCRARNRTGGRCRLYASPNSDLCPRHSLRPTDKPEDLDLSAHFGDQMADLSTAVQVNAFITTLIRLTVRSEISSRRAAVLGYLTNQLLRSVPAVASELNPEPEVPMPTFSWARRDPAEPEPEPSVPDPRSVDQLTRNGGLMSPSAEPKSDEPHDPYDGWRPPKY